MPRLLSRVLLKTVARTVLTLLYRVEVKGAENFRLTGKHHVIVANHQSFLDAAVIAE
jgi:acyl-[acyl-carrier-protein]-phospholipid O-acyltransferase/long-chain-fatty-acid--[acyl-carrier-protein] ligase